MLHASPKTRLFSWLVIGLSFATLLSPLTALAAPPTRAELEAVSTPAEAREFFLGKRSETGEAQADFHASGYSSSIRQCSDGDAGSAKPYTCVYILRDGRRVGFTLFPLVAMVRGPDYQLWIFRSEANPQVAVGYRAEAGGRDAKFFALLPADPAADEQAARLLASPPATSRIAAIEIRGEPGRTLRGNEQSAAAARAQTETWGVKLWEIERQSRGGIQDRLLDGALGAVQDKLNDLLGFLVEQFASLIDDLLVNDYLRFVGGGGGAAIAAGGESGTQTAPVVEVWDFLRDVANVFFLLILLAIAAGSVLRLESYAVRALLPRFVVAVILVNFSLIIAQVVLDGVALVTEAFLGDVTFGPIVTSLLAASALVVGGAGGALFFGSFLLVTILLAVFTVLVLLVARIAVLWLLVATAPAAFLASILPATRELYSDWWKNFIRFAMIAPVMAIVLRLAAEFSGTEATGEGSALLRVALIVALIFMAGIVPVMVGGKFMGTIQKFLQKRGEGLRKTALERSSGSIAMGYMRQRGEMRAQLRGAELSDALGSLTGGLAGTRGQAGAELKDQAGKQEDAVGSLSGGEMRALIHNRRVPEAARVAAATTLAKAELLNEADLLDLPRVMRASAASSVIREAMKKNPVSLLEGRHRRAVREILNRYGHEGYLAPKFISDERGDALYKIAIRWKADDIMELGATQLARLPAHIKAEVNLGAREIEKLSQRAFFGLISRPVAHEVSSLLRNGAWRRQLEDQIRAQVGEISPIQLHELVLERLVDHAARRDSAVFGSFGRQTQLGVIKRLRDAGFPSGETERGTVSAQWSRERDR